MATIEYSPYPPAKKVPTNTWFLGISWVSGDADHRELVHYRFKSEAEFIRAIEVFEKAMQYVPGEHTRKIQNILWDELKIDVEWDITNEQFCADPQFGEHYYIDADGVKKLVEVV